MKKMLTRSVVFAALSLSPLALAQDAEPAAAPTDPASTAPTATAVAIGNARLMVIFMISSLCGVCRLVPAVSWLGLSSVRSAPGRVRPVAGRRG